MTLYDRLRALFGFGDRRVNTQLGIKIDVETERRDAEAAKKAAHEYGKKLAENRWMT